MSLNITVCTFIRSLPMTKFEPKEGAIMPLALQTVNSTETSIYDCSSRHPCRPSTNYRYGRLHSALCALPLVNLCMEAHSQHLTRSIQERGQACNEYLDSRPPSDILCTFIIIIGLRSIHTKTINKSSSQHAGPTTPRQGHPYRGNPSLQDSKARESVHLGSSASPWIWPQHDWWT